MIMQRICIMKSISKKIPPIFTIKFFGYNEYFRHRRDATFEYSITSFIPDLA